MELNVRGFMRPEGNVSHIAVIGCGGIGARIIPALVKMVMPGTEIHVVDPDIVEERNLVRQHFCRSDIGKFKAEVMAERYHTSAVPVIPYVGRFPQEVGLRELVNTRFGTVFYIGGVDSRRTRHEMSSHIRHNSGGLYIDIGNDGSGGQVVLTGYAPVLPLGNGSEAYPGYYAANGLNTKLRGEMEFPDVFDPAGDARDEQASCGFIMDTQTVLANQMAATIGLNYVGMWLYRLPIYTLGASFSTLNMVQPIKVCIAQPWFNSRSAMCELFPVGKSPTAEADAKRAAKLAATINEGETVE